MLERTKMLIGFVPIYGTIANVAICAYEGKTDEVILNIVMAPLDLLPGVKQAAAAAKQGAKSVFKSALNSTLKSIGKSAVKGGVSVAKAEAKSVGK